MMFRRSGGMVFRDRTRVLAVVATLAITAMGCSADGEGTPSAGTEAPAATGADATAPLELSGDPIKIGVLMPMSGPSASSGALQMPSVEFWLEEHQDTGILGRPIELIVRDDGGNAGQAATAARRLIDDDQVDMVLGPSGSDAVSGALPLLSDAKITAALLSAFLPARDPEQFPYAYPFEFSTAQIAEALLRAVDEAGGTEVGYLAANDTLGNALHGVVSDNLPDGTELVNAQFYEPGATDVTTQVQNLRSSGADVIVMGDAVQPQLLTNLTSVETLGWDDVRIVGLSPLGGKAIVDSAPPDVLERALAIGYAESNLRPVDQELLDWRDRYLEFTEQDEAERGIYQLMRPYEALEFLREMAEATGSVDADVIKEYIEGEGSWEGMTGTYVFTAEQHLGLESDASVNPGTWDNGTYDRPD